ncbi:MAG: sodium:alanine symporter family protein [Candidatus Eisenbacteria bacterium]
MDRLREIVFGLSGIVWGWPDAAPLLVLILIGTGLVTTFALGWIQVRRFAHGIQVIRGKYDNPEDEGDITHFQALTTALSATVGIGNIAGVATAIHYGGPGALFWMWVTAVFGMALKYAECTLSMRYRAILPSGEASGGPMYYIERGLGRSWKPVAVFFALCAVVSSFGSGNAVQAFTVADQFRADLGVPTWLTGVGMVALVGAVILGGIRRIGEVTSRLAPLMAVTYVAGALLVLLAGFSQVPAVLAEIVRSAFQPAAKVGGFAGGGFIFLLTWGVKRGLFSNESGQGSAPIAHAAAKTKEPVREGVVAMVGPFIDTLVICTLTGLVILTTGVWKERRPEIVEINPQAAITLVRGDADVGKNARIGEDHLVTGQVRVERGEAKGVRFVRNHSLVENAAVLTEGGDPFEGTLVADGGNIQDPGRPLRLAGAMAQNGSPLTAWAFDEGLPFLGGRGHFIVTLAVFLFGISTAISWSYYGDRATVYLAGPKYVLPYKLLYLVMHFLGAIFPLELVWGFGDIALGLMALPNLIAIVVLLPKIRAMTEEYFSREHVPFR